MRKKTDKYTHLQMIAVGKKKQLFNVPNNSGFTMTITEKVIGGLLALLVGAGLYVRFQ
jgi:hypothetical protein